MASSTATSRPPTSCSRARAGRCWPTSAWLPPATHRTAPPAGNADSDDTVDAGRSDRRWRRWTAMALAAAVVAALGVVVLARPTGTQRAEGATTHPTAPAPTAAPCVPLLYLP